MGTTRKQQQLALQGGMKAVTTIEGRGKPKIGVDEFMSLAERFGISPTTRKRIRTLLTDREIGEGPFLANYYSGLKESKVEAYERGARKVFGAKYAIGTSSGTGALHAAFVAVGVGPGTEVICPAIGFFATAAAVVMARGVPVFCDVDESMAIDPAKIEALITPRTVAVCPTHVMGSVCDMAAVMRVAREHKIMVVEDAAQSCGARFNGRYAGTIGDIGCFSISAYKTCGGGEGGLLLTNKKRLWERAQGIVETGGLWRPDRFGPERYEGELYPGTNYRMSELEAAVDVVQLKKLATTVKRFHTVKGRILDRLKTYSEIVPQKLNDADGEVGYYLRFCPETLPLAEKIAKALNAEGIKCSARGRNAPPDWHHYSFMFPVTLKGAPTDVACPFDCSHYLARGGFASYARGDCPVADDLFDRTVTVNLNQWLTARDCHNVADGINKVLSAYCTQDRDATPWS